MKVRLFIFTTACAFAAWLGVAFVHQSSAADYPGLSLGEMGGAQLEEADAETQTAAQEDDEHLVAADQNSAEL